MARKQATNYNEKRADILGHATQLFANKGFHATSITDIAIAGQTSKSRLYHYFISKEQVLYEILIAHAQILTDTFIPIMDEKSLTAQHKLEKYTRQLLRLNVQSRAQHKLILNELTALSPSHRQDVNILLRKPISIIYQTLAEINPNLARSKNVQFPAAMMFLGMVNWSHTWFSDEGELSIAQFAKLICDTFINGFQTANLPTS